MYIDGRRHYENLNIHLPKERNKQGEYRRMAEEVRATRELEIQSAPHGYIPSFKKDASFIDFFDELTKTKHKTWSTTLYQLRQFTSADISFKRINGKWLDEFQEFLLERVCPNTANAYLHKIKASLNVALKEGIINANPCEMIDIVKTQPSERTYRTFE